MLRGDHCCQCAKWGAWEKNAANLGRVSGQLPSGSDIKCTEEGLLHGDGWGEQGSRVQQAWDQIDSGLGGRVSGAGEDREETRIS